MVWRGVRRLLSDQVRPHCCTLSGLLGNQFAFLTLAIFASQALLALGTASAAPEVDKDLRECIDRETARIFSKMTRNLARKFDDEKHIQEALGQIYDNSLIFENKIISACAANKGEELINPLILGDPEGLGEGIVLV